MGPVAAPAPSPSPPGPSPTPAPVPVYAPSAPQDVVAEPGDGRITVTWKAPASSGSFPITNYQAIATPGAGSCVVGAGAMGCDVTGLVDGASYTVSVRALSGAGWGTPSAAEGPIVPDPIEPVTMTITGTREGRTIMIEGTSVGVVAGTVVRPWVKLRGQSSYSQGVASRVLSRGNVRPGRRPMCISGARMGRCAQPGSWWRGVNAEAETAARPEVVTSVRVQRRRCNVCQGEVCARLG